jgi:hypothetical protein
MILMTVFPISKVNALRKRAIKACPEPDRGAEGWSKSTIDPMNLLKVFESLRLKVGLVLRAYQFHAGHNGNGIIWAMPADALFPSPDNCPRLSDRFLKPPKPPGAVDDLMDAVEGDGTPWSYLSASLFTREAAEFGAIWHGCSWSTHAILGADPWYCEPEAKDRRKRQPLATGNAETWKWNEPIPEAWAPAFRDDGQSKSIEFFTFSGLGQESIFGFRDIYAKDGYRFETQKRTVAQGAYGYIF